MIHNNKQDLKLKIIEQLIILDDDVLFHQVEKLIDKSLQRPSFKKFTKQELQERAMLAEQDIADSNVFTPEEVDRLSQHW